MFMKDYQYHIFSPYRVCPLGAYVDHQHGLVTGFAIDKGVDLWFDVREDSFVKLSSRTFEGDEDCIGGRTGVYQTEQRPSGSGLDTYYEAVEKYGK